MAGAASAILGAAAALFLHPGKSTSSAPPIRFAIDLGGPGLGARPEVSPDGSRVAYLASDGTGIRSLHIRRLDDDIDLRLAGSEGAQTPFWSGDGRWIAFFADGKLSKIPVSGGRPQTIASIPGLASGAWSATGDIVFAASLRSPLYHVRDTGGAPRQITQLDLARTENSHRFPCFLPGARQYLYTARATDRRYAAVYLASLDSPAKTRIDGIQSNVQYLPARDGRAARLLYVRDGALVTQEFDGTRLNGEPVPVVESVSYVAPSVSGEFGVSADGRVLVYQGETARSNRLYWFDRAGKKTGELGSVEGYGQPRISPDGTRVLFSRPDTRTGNRDIWMIDIAGGATTRLTNNPANDWFPTWSPDGRQFEFASDRGDKVGMEPFL